MPYGSNFFFFNTRRKLFNDIRVRQAISLMFDFEWTSRIIFRKAYIRSSSYFPNTYLAATSLPNDMEKHIFSQWLDILPDEFLVKPFTNHVNSGDGTIRNPKRQALHLLKQAGWELQNNILVYAKTGEAFEFEYMEKSSAASRYILPWKKNLSGIGITMKYRQIDISQYFQRLRSHDFDMVEYILPQTLAPDQELFNYFHSSQANVDGSQNLAGISHPAIDAIVEKIPETKTKEEMQAQARSLDKILLSYYFGVPKWYSNFMRIAYKDIFGWPDIQTVYSTPFSTWWVKTKP